MKEIKLSNHSKCKTGLLNLVALVDDEDFEMVSKYHWHVVTKKNRYYLKYYAGSNVVINGKKTSIRMHRLIMGVTDPKINIDHIKANNTLDNRKSNLRQATAIQNSTNKRAFGECKYLGVHINKSTVNGRDYHYFFASIRVNGKPKFIGSFKNEILAATAYDKAALKYHGEFANPNFACSRIGLNI